MILLMIGRERNQKDGRRLQQQRNKQLEREQEVLPFLKLKQLAEERQRLRESLEQAAKELVLHKQMDRISQGGREREEREREKETLVTLTLSVTMSLMKRYL